MSKKYKIVIFGATGFTGELCARFMSEKYSDIPIAIAGRSAEKLEKIKNTNNLPFPIVVADAFNVNSLEKMCRDTEVVLSTAGPYHKYGSDLLGVCVKHGCHYIDITGEISIFEIANKLDNEALNSNIVLCPGVGSDVIPTDCLAAYLKDKLPDATHLKMAWATKGSKSSKGTDKTAVEGMGKGCNIRENGKMKKIKKG